jgi:opacity protein-like surface antigen
MNMRRFLIVFAMGFLAANIVGAADERFYGGLAVRPSVPGVAPVGIGSVASAWTKLTPLKNEISGGTLLYGGYRFQQLPLLGVEAAISNTGDSSRLGLYLDPNSLGGGPSDLQPRNWNVDVFTNLAVNPGLGVYGRMGYGYNEAARNVLSAANSLSAQDSVLRKSRDGFNYGVGLRYDLNQALGLRLEWSRYSRITRFGSDAIANNPQPDSDQLSIGVQYRF